MCVECDREYGETRRKSLRKPAVCQFDSFTKEPGWWPDDGGKLRVPIYDHVFTPPRLVRRVGWVNCLGYGARHRFLSDDVTKARICTKCKTIQQRVDGTEII